MNSGLVLTLLLSCTVLVLTVGAKKCQDTPMLARQCRMMKRSFGRKICLTNYFSIRKLMKNHCKATCGFCIPKGKALAPPIPCDRSMYGCCWDDITPAKDIAGRGCPICANRHEVVCRMFRWMCPSRKVNADYVKMNCPFSCGKCEPTKPGGYFAPSIYDFYARAIKKLHEHKTKKNQKKKLQKKNQKKKLQKKDQKKKLQKT